MRKHFVAFTVVAFMVASVIGVGQALAADTSHPEFKLSIFCSSFGTRGYTAAFALGDLINKNHPWLKAAVMETTQASDAVKTVLNDPKLRKNSIFPLSATSHYEAVEGRGAFQGTPVKYNVLAMYMSDTVAFCTIDPEIRTMADLNGKRLSMGSRGGAGPSNLAILKAHGVEPAKIEYISWGPGKDALIDGKIDAAAQTLGCTGLDPYVPPGNIQQLLTKEHFHVIPMDTEKLKGITSHLITPGEIRAGILNVSKPIFGAASRLTWSVSPEFDPEVAYEIAKFVAEHAKDFASYDKGLRSVQRETLVAVSIPPREMHPGALKYYREAGIKIGLE